MLALLYFFDTKGKEPVSALSLAAQSAASSNDSSIRAVRQPHEHEARQRGMRMHTPIIRRIFRNKLRNM